MTIAAPPPGLQPEDYEEIEAAVMETARGRWFLAEYGRRARAAEGEKLLAALERLEARLEAHGALAPEETFSVSERLAELAWTLRERGVEDFVCGKIDALAREFSWSATVRPRRRENAAPANARPGEPPAAPQPKEASAASMAVQEPPTAPFPSQPANDQASDALTPSAAPESIVAAKDLEAVEPAPSPIAGTDAETRAAPPEPPPPPVDPRLAALAWLDRLPLVDRMALFA
jgi:hypothetical protein